MNGEWSLGQQLCDVWTSLDVMLCTASILNLCAISIDRYFVITHPLQYATKRTPLRMAMMIVAVWALSALISVPALVVWKASPIEGQCYLGPGEVAVSGLAFVSVSVDRKETRTMKSSREAKTIWSLSSRFGLARA